MGQTKEIYLVIRGQRWTNQWKILAFYNRRKAMKYAWKKSKKRIRNQSARKKIFQRSKRTAGDKRHHFQWRKVHSGKLNYSDSLIKQYHQHGIDAVLFLLLSFHLNKER